MQRPLRSGADALRAWLNYDPAWWVFPVAGICWIGLSLHAAAPTSWTLCTESGPRLTGGLPETATAILVSWLLMVGGMALPIAAPLLRHISARSFTFRRSRAMGLFIGGLLSVWISAGLVIAPALSRLPDLSSGPVVGAIGFALAALYQFVPARRMALRRCHRTAPLTALGWRADRDCLLLGFARGRDCLLSCGVTMLAACLAGHALAVMLIVATLAQAERWPRDPIPAPPAVVLAGLGLLQLVPT